MRTLRGINILKLHKLTETNLQKDRIELCIEFPIIDGPGSASLKQFQCWDQNIVGPKGTEPPGPS